MQKHPASLDLQGVFIDRRPSAASIGKGRATEYKGLLQTAIQEPIQRSAVRLPLASSLEERGFQKAHNTMNASENAGTPSALTWEYPVWTFCANAASHNPHAVRDGSPHD